MGIDAGSVVTRGFIFPGQGAQFVGMGKSVYDTFPSSRALYEQAKTILGCDIAGICFSGPEEELNKTLNSQPAIFVTSLAIMAAIKEVFPHLKPSACFGLSLGEYTALVAAGVVSFADGLRLVQKRAQAMEMAAAKAGGAMASVLNLDIAVIEEACRQAGGVWVANFNAPDQVVISGTTAGVAKASQTCSEKGAKRVIPLKVSGAFHSQLMAPAREALREAVEKTVFNSPVCTFIPNFTAAPERDPAKIKAYLLEQLTGTVKWSTSFSSMVTNGVTSYLEVGPGNVLKGLARRIVKEAEVVSVEKAEDVEALKK